MNERSLAAYIDAVSQPTPAPGAGSVSAIVGSLGCALGEMVCAITLNNPKIKPDARLRSAAGVLTECRSVLVELSYQDEEAYRRFREAQALPKASASEKQARFERMSETLEWATEVPLKIAETSATALHELIVVANSGSRLTLADVTTAAFALNAAMKGSMENVWVNLRMMKDAETSEFLRNRADDALLRGAVSLNHAIAEAGRRAGLK